MFLKLKLQSTGEEVIVNADQIKYLFPVSGATVIYLIGESKQCVEVREAPYSIWKQLVAGATK